MRSDLTQSNESSSSSDEIIRELHLIREAIVESFKGDLHALVSDAWKRQLQSGRTIFCGKSPSKTGQRNEAQSNNLSRSATEK